MATNKSCLSDDDDIQFIEEQKVTALIGEDVNAKAESIRIVRRVLAKAQQKKYTEKNFDDNLRNKNLEAHLMTEEERILYRNIFFATQRWLTYRSTTDQHNFIIDSSSLRDTMNDFNEKTLQNTIKKNIMQ